MSSVYVTWVYRTFYSHYSVHIPKELKCKCKQLFDNCKNLRQNRPHVFCGFVTSLLFLLAVIGHVMNGTYVLLGKVQLAFMRCAPVKQWIFHSQSASSLAFCSHPNMKLRSSKRTTVSVSSFFDFSFLVWFAAYIFRMYHYDLWRHEWADWPVVDIYYSRDQEWKKNKISCDKVVGLKKNLFMPSHCMCLTFTFYRLMFLNTSYGRL